MKVWKDYTIEDAIIVIEKAVKAVKSETVNSCWRDCIQMLYDFTWLTIKPIKKIMKGIEDRAKKAGEVSKVFQDMDVGKIQELINTTDELTKNLIYFYFCYPC